MYLSVTAAALALVASAVPDMDESPKEKHENHPMIGLLDSYWTHWWTKQSDTEITFYEEWSFELQGGKYWTKGSEL